MDGKVAKEGRETDKKDRNWNQGLKKQNKTTTEYASIEKSQDIIDNNYCNSSALKSRHDVFVLIGPSSQKSGSVLFFGYSNLV